MRRSIPSLELALAASLCGAVFLTACGGAASQPDDEAVVEVAAPETAAEASPNVVEAVLATPPAPVVEEDGADEPSLPPELKNGEVAYDNYCSECHGLRGVGTDIGPPHVHVVYEPGHHGDATFRSAVANGVPAHHWPYGDMEPVEGLSERQVDEIIAYVRWLQRQAGIR